MSVLTRAAIVQKISEVSPQVRKLGVARLALFGSCARDEASPTSDVDLLIEFEPGQKSFGNLLDVADLLESVLDRRVDAVTTESLSPYIGPKILAEAIDVLRAA